MSKKLRLGIVASGGGTNLQSIIDACQQGSIDAEVAVVVSNNPLAGALERGRKAGIPTRCVNHREFKNRESFDAALVEALRDEQVELVCLAGFMRLLTSTMLEAFPERIVNIHPSLLPAFPGMNVQRHAIEYGARFSGCTVHFVDGGTDTGPIIIQAAVPVLDDDDEDTLSNRILQQEHRIYPRAIQLFAEGRLRIEGRRVRIVPPPDGEDGAIVNPPLA
ncbi:MAG: phosphoribosylglycinamide formyltransferase [Desulfuromonadales bacterium]